MNLPNLKEARIRNKKEVTVYTNDYKVPEEIKDYGIGKKYYMLTYGCQMNVHDSENIKAILEDMKFIQTDNMEESNIIVLNTCAIRENAHNKVLGMLGRIKHLKESREDLITIFCGCMAQEEGIANLLKDKYKWVDIVMGTHNIHKLPLYLEETIKKNKQLLEVLSKAGLEIIEAEGKEFDPNFHEAVMQTPTSEYPEHTIINELQKGYKLEDRVLRPSLVNVATAE